MASTITLPGDNVLTETDVVDAVTALKADIEDGGVLTATVAAAGADNTDAAAVDYGFTLVSAANGTKGVILPAAVAGKVVYIKNNVAANLKVYPASGDQINALTVTTGALTIGSLKAAMFHAYDTTTWYTTPLVPS
jgi:hypothetical protein